LGLDSEIWPDNSTFDDGEAGTAATGSGRRCLLLFIGVAPAKVWGVSQMRTTG
jgi:hypothetical protein